MIITDGNLLSNHDVEEGDADAEEDDPTIFKTLSIKVVPVNSRENTGAVLYHDDDADDEEDDDDDHHHHY